MYISKTFSVYVSRQFLLWVLVMILVLVAVVVRFIVLDIHGHGVDVVAPNSAERLA